MECQWKINKAAVDAEEIPTQEPLNEATNIFFMTIIAEYLAAAMWLVALCETWIGEAWGPRAHSALPPHVEDQLFALICEAWGQHERCNASLGCHVRPPPQNCTRLTHTCQL